ncbi:hypothetical protein KCU97_g15113, partial [Aureobasidium melanogenum]
WAKAPKSADHLETPWISRFAALVQCSIEIVGPLPFSEENLARSESKNFEAAPTPSNRSSKHHARLQSPAVFLFDLFAQPPLTISTNIAYSDAARGLLHQICQGRNSRKERLELVRKCSQSSLASTSALLWTTAVQETTAVLLDSTLNESVQEPARLGHQARHAISILASGLHHEHEESGALAAAFELVSVLARILKQEAGEGGVVLGLMEPLAEALLQRRDEIISKSVFVQFSEKVLRVGAFPRNKQQMDEARRSLWNTHPPLSKQSSFEPFNHVYELANSALLISYVSIEETAQCLAQFTAAVQDFLSKCPLSLFASPALRRVQHGLSLVIKDEGRVIAGSKETREVFSRVLALWQSILTQLKNLPSNKTLLKGLDELFAAGLNSTHRDIINLTVSFWNTTFGQLDSLEYPSQVEEAMRRLRPLVELDLPTFPENDDASAPSPLRDLIESQQDMNVQETPSPIKQQPIRRSKRTSVLNRAISSSPQSEKPTTRRQPTSKGAPKSKLRHNDSQVEFTAVESSSPVAMESQLLTEHQREVRSRQQFETAPLYPEFSSSPGPRRRASKSGLPLLDFSNQQAGTENGYATPTLNDDHGPMDEYITSSPTPKAAEKLQPAAVQNTDLVDSAPEVEDDNIPSSPPEMADEEMGDETVYEGTTEIENLQIAEQQGSSHSRFDTVPEDFSTIVPQEETRLNDSKALPEKAPTVKQAANVHVQAHPSMKRLAQNLEGGVSSDVFTDAHSELNNKISNMDDSEKSSQAAREELGDQNAIESDDSSPIPFTDSLIEQPQEEADDSADLSAHKTAATPGDIDEVLDSFVGSTPDENDTASAKEKTQPNPAIRPNPALSASKRKREEPQEVRDSVKRRKSSASPFRRMMTRAYSFVTGSQVEKEDDDDDDDEEVQDCIVVGSQRDQEDESQSEPAENSP